MGDLNEKPIKRRDFLNLAALGTFAAAIGVSCLGMLRLAVPRVFPEPSKTFKIGIPSAFKKGEILSPAGRSVHVFHDDNGFYAISSICTHLGCIVKISNNEFLCPCHGSRFAMNGNVISGAASRPLDWYSVSLAPDGQLQVDESKTVKPGTFLTV